MRLHPALKYAGCGSTAPDILHLVRAINWRVYCSRKYSKVTSESNTSLPLCCQTSQIPVPACMRQTIKLVAELLDEILGQSRAP